MIEKLFGSPFTRAAIIILAVALLTLVPRGASHANGLGYYSLCSFAPWSTIILVVLAFMVHRLGAGVTAAESGKLRRGY
jgi:hypothetical protein